MNKKICVGILAHVDAGKTTLIESMLYTSGQIRKLGRVDHKDAFLDYDKQERDRGITIYSKEAFFSWKNTDIFVLDTPGHIDFSSEMERTLQVLDLAILLINGQDGIQSHSETIWKCLAHYQVPTLIFINKMDISYHSKEELMKDIHEKFSENCIDFTQNDLYESLAMINDSLLNEYMNSQSISLSSIQNIVFKRECFPCFFGSALKLEGIENLLDAMGDYTLEKEYGNEFGAKIYKITMDEQGNPLTHIKITSGTLKAKQKLNEDNKVDQIRLYNGKNYTLVNEASAGMICTLKGLENYEVGQGLGIETDSEKPLLNACLNYHLLLPDGFDPIQMKKVCDQLESQDPSLHIEYDTALKKISIQLMGDIQMEVLQKKIEQETGIQVGFSTGNVIFKETIADTVTGVGHFEPLRHYAEVHLKLEPLKRNSGLQFESDVSMDDLSLNWQRLILTHLQEKKHKGVLTGSPITDMKITLIAGKSHLKHTEGGDFRQATYRAVRHGLMQADSVLLEPCYAFRLELPTENVGRAMNDIQNMHGTFTLEETDSAGNLSVITGKAPVSCMQDYQTKVTAYTGGQGHITCEPAGYQVCHNTEEVLAKSIYDPERDMRNPASSVFCAHGAGFVVEWDSVEFFMHVDSGLMLLQPPIDPEERVIGRARESFDYDSIGTEEIDEIIAKSSSANRRPGSNRRIGWNGKQRTGVKRISAVTGNNGQGDNKFSADGATGGLQNEGSRKNKAKPQVKKSAYLLVDGYNVIFAWNSLKALAAVNIDSARDRLLDILSNYQGMKGVEVIVVFDAYRVTGHKTEYFDYHNIHVVYTREAETADRYIERFAHENNEKYDITVATSDGLEQIIIRGAGCRLLSSRDLETEIEKANHAFREAYMSNSPSLRNYLMDYFPEGMDS